MPDLLNLRTFSGKNELGEMGGICSTMLLFFGPVLETQDFVKEHVMPRGNEKKIYTSPRYKLLEFFETSRDGWKRKCQETKTVLKRMKNRACAIQLSRDRWKRLARQRDQEIEQLRRELEAQKRTIG